MYAVPAICDRHGIVPTALSVEPGTDVTVIDSAAVCPHCGRFVRMANGTYVARERGLVFRPHPSYVPEVDPTTGARWTRERINLAISALEAAERAGTADLDATIEVVDEISPPMGQVLRKVTSKWTTDRKIALASVIIPSVLTLLQMAQAARAEERPTTEELVVIVRSVCEFDPTAVQPDGSSEPGITVPSPTPPAAPAATPPPTLVPSPGPVAPPAAEEP